MSDLLSRLKLIDEEICGIRKGFTFVITETFLGFTRASVSGKNRIGQSFCLFVCLSA